VLSSEVVHPEPRTEAPLQTDGALDHNTFDDIDDDTLTHHIPQIAHPAFVKTLTGAVANTSQNVEASTRGFEGPTTQQIRRPIGFTASQGAQVEAFAANTTTADLLPLSSQQASSPS
jgi:hypothetical protein